jgi:hypothetical protein
MNPLSQYGLMGGITAGFLPQLGPIFSAANLGEAGLGLAARYGFSKGEQINDWMVSERMARIGMTLNRPTDILSHKAEIASPFGMMTQAVLGKNYSSRIGYVSAINDPLILASLGNKKLREEVANIRAYGEGTARGTAALLTNEGRLAAQNKGIASAYLGSANQNTGSFLGDVFGGVGSFMGTSLEWLSRVASPNPKGPTAGTTQETKFDIARREELAKLDPQGAAILRQAIQNKTELQGPLFNHMVDEIYGNAMGRTMNYRALGMGGGILKDEKGNYTTALEAHRAKLLKRGWDLPNEEGARQAILSIGLGYNKVYGQSSDLLMGMGLSGLSNAPQLMKLGGLLTGELGNKKEGGGAYDFIQDVVQGSIGTGGIGIATGREMIESLAQMALKSGQFGRGKAAGDMIKHYVGLATGYQGYEFNEAEQQRRSMNIQLGLTEFERYTSGKAAPMYDVMRQVSAIQATGGKWSYLTDVLSNLNPALQKSITEGGAMPLEYQGYLTPGMVKKHQGVMQNAPFAELMGFAVPKFTGTGLNYEQAQRDLRLAQSKGGGVKEAIEQHMIEFGKAHPGLERKEIADEQYRYLRTAGGLYAMAHGAPWDKGEGMLEGFLGSEFWKGKGAHVTGPKAGEAAALADQGETEAARGRAGAPAGVAIQQGKGGQGADILSADEHAYDYIRTGGAGLPGAFGNLKNAIDIVVRALPNAGPINYSAGKTTGPKGSPGRGKTSSVTPAPKTEYIIPSGG